MTTPYIDPNLIFAENAPVQDKPAAFANYDKGWDESRNNDGRPLIPQMNYLTQQADLKNLYIHENGAALPYKEGVAYEENAVVVKDGVLQQWKGGEWELIKIPYDDLESISEMLAITNPTDGMRIFVKGLQGGWFEYNAPKSSINDGVMIFNGWVRITLEMGIKPEWAGAPHNGIDDDAAAIRKCIEYCEAFGAKRIIFTNNGKSYIAATVDANNSAFTIKSTGILLDFENTATVIEAKVAMESILYFQSTSYRIGINNGTLSCNNLANYGINTNPAIYTPQIEIHGLTITDPIEDGVVVQAFVGDISKLTVNGGKRGLVIKPVAGNIVTSLSIRSCYMLNQTVCGYDFDVTCYCVLIGCAADNMPLAYSLNMRGGAMIGCGAENIEKIARFTSFRGLSINGFYSQRAGSTDSANPTDYLLEFVTGTNATLAGFHLESNAGRYYGKKVGITTKNYAYESLTVTDQSILRSDIYFIANSGSNRPIKLLFDDTTQRDLTVNINSIDQFREYIATYLDDYEINHTLTIQLANGTYNFGDIPSVINSLRGTGRLIIRGSASNRASVKLETEVYRLIVRNCQCLVEFRDLTLSSSVASGAAERLRVDRAIVELNNVLVSKNSLNAAYGIRVINGGRVYINSNTIADAGGYTIGTFHRDSTSRFVMEPASAAPTTLNWSQGMKVENSNPVTNMGWVFSGGAWKTYGAIT